MREFGVDIYTLLSSGSVVKNLPADERDAGCIPGLGRSPGEGKGYPLQYSDLENSIDYTVHGFPKSQTPLSDFHFHFRDSLIAQLVKNPPAMQETPVRFLSQEDPLEKG